jgi:hypothetical protein
MTRIHLRRTGRVGLALGLIALAAMWPASIAIAGNGNNGTVKVHEGATDTEPAIRNEPHVCTFHLHFFFADGAQQGSWSIGQQAPTGSDASVLEGTYAADANGEFATVEFGLPTGHYTLDWEGRNDQNLKHKTFWVTCANPAGPIDNGGGGGVG